MMKKKIEVSEEVHQGLVLYKVHHKHKTISDAVRALLDRK